MMSNELILIAAPALVAGLMIALTHAPLGVEVLKRGIIFIDLAIAQIAGVGLIVSQSIFHDSSIILTQLFALSFAITASLIFRKIEKYLPNQQEAIIGVSYIIAASVTVLLLANNPHSDEKIQNLLSGQILFITFKDIFSHCIIYIVTLVMWFSNVNFRKGIYFYIIFAFAITSSVQLVGVYLVFASLILPALAALNYQNKNIAALTCGVIAVTLGIVLSIKIDLPSGPVIVLCYALVATIFALIGSYKNKQHPPLA